MESEKQPHTTDVDLLGLYYKSDLGLRKKTLKQTLIKFQEDNDLGEGELFKRTKTRRIVKLRWKFFHLMRNDLGYSLCAIGRMFKMHHTAVLRGCRKYEVSNGFGRQNLERKTEDAR